MYSAHDYIVLVLLSHTASLCVAYTQHAFSKQSLDMYCSRTTGGRNKYSSHPKLQKYFMICRNVNQYKTCILKTRALTVVPANITINPYEKYFPSGADLEIAAYTLCMKDLLKIWTVLEKKDLACEQKINTSKCLQLHAPADTLLQLNTFIGSRPLDIDAIETLSCSVSAPLTSCIEDLYLDCSHEYELFRNYELATFGRDCLEKHKLYSSYISVKRCISSACTWSHVHTIVWMMLATQLILMSPFISASK